jgi:hypothetical protein
MFGIIHHVAKTPRWGRQRTAETLFAAAVLP